MRIRCRIYDLAMKASEIRKARGLSQVELAEQAGVEQPTISRFERGADGITLGVVRQIAKALDVSVAELLDEDRSETEQALLSVFRSLSPERQRGWVEMATALLPDQQKSA